MTKSLNDLLDYINDNILFGSKMNQNVIDGWFKDYTLSIEEKYSVYEELESLNITIIDHPKTILHSTLFKLYKCIESETNINKSFLVRLFSQNNIKEKTQEEIIGNLIKKGYDIIDDIIDDTEEDIMIDLPDDIFEDYEDNLDAVLEDDDFIGHVDSLEDVIDKSRNLEYLKDAHSEDDEKRNKSLSNLIQANERLVWSVVKRYSRLATMSFTEEDMFQSGVIGLLKAAERFDISKGFQFSTYAIWWIKQAITRDIADYSTLIRIPVHNWEKMNKLLRTESELWNKNSRPPTPLELSIEMEEPIEKIEELQFYIYQSNLDSLDRPVGEEETTPLGDLVQDENIELPEDEFFKLEIRQILDEIFFSILNDREIEVLYHRFGFIDHQVKTLEEIGEIFNVTRERIRQIESGALRKLRNTKMNKILKEYSYEY